MPCESGFIGSNMQFNSGIKEPYLGMMGLHQSANKTKDRGNIVKHCLTLYG